jgi:protein-disulfide isomerase
MKIFYALFGAVALVGLGLLAYSLASEEFVTIVTEPVELDGAEESQGLRELARGISLGREDAPITIIEFSDFECPGCALFAQQVKPQLDEELIQTGRARLIFYDYPLMHLHPTAFLAARAAKCAEDQDGFWPYHDALYADQARWARHSSPPEAFEEIAGDLGMDRGVFRTCLAGDTHAEVVTANLRLAQELRLPGTPTVLINTGGQESRGTPGFDFESIMNTIDEMTGEAGGTAAAEGPAGGGGV